MKGKVRIQEFRIRATGLTREQGRRLGELVAKQLNESARKSTGSRNINEISIQFRSDGHSIDRLATDVTRQIRRKLN
jgi:hypothetical protein